MTNRATLHGTLDRDPEFRTFANGGSVANLRIATVETWQQGGETKTRTEWHSVAVFADRALETLRNARKGDTIEVDGKIETRSWADQAGNKRYTTEIVVRPAPGHGVKTVGAAAPAGATKPAPDYDDLPAFLMPEQRRLGLLEALLVVQAHMMRLGAEITLRKAMEPDNAVRHADRDYLWALAGYDALGDIEAELIVATRPERATIH